MATKSACGELRHLRGIAMAHRRLESGLTSSPAVMFGEALRFAREQAGYTQEDLGRLLHCHRTVITRWEGGKRPMDRDTVQRADAALAMGGLLVRLWERVDWHADIEHPDWFQKYVELEEEAVAIRVFQYYRINGLLQCEEYAYAVFSNGGARDNPELVAERVAARLSRQDRFLASDGPMLLVVLHESAIRSVYGGPGVMRKQMEHLLALGERPNISIQVAPFDLPNTRLPATSVFLLQMPDGKEWVYSESLYRGHFTDAPSIVVEHRGDLDFLRGDVLSVGDSRARIADAMERYRYDEQRAQRDRVAQEQLQRGSRGRVHRGGPRIPSRSRPGA
ncbi:Scr1 family TA system antitoxin-like transcriptional regulator [Kitasatospora sp. NPDC057940]|uniref:Scr1 family TA system antitoxin-like transcriptional regulator n=1 Tax=unclassified Kitasatospora TaxID=2633591 RepID=UPI00352E0100